MSLERKDIRAKLDPDMHEALAVLADIDQVDIGEFVERELVAVIRRRIHDAIQLAEATAHLGIAGKNRSLPGMSPPRARR
jgi:CO dehydrogenase/acetyl-CoA synthase beta subunit